MEKLSTKKKLAVVRQYLSGLSYDEIAAKSGVSKGTVANVVADLKAGSFAEASDVGEHIEQLRELSLDLKRSKLSPGQCATGLLLLTRINECGLDPADIGRWPMILKSLKNEDEAQEFVRLVYSIEEVQKRSGLSLEALDNKAHELERKAADLEPTSEKLKDYQKQLAELTRRREELAGAVAVLEQKYELLTPRVKDLEKREQILSRRIVDIEPKAQKAETTLSALNAEIQKLSDIGLSLKELAEFNDRLQVIAQHHAIAPAELRSRLLQELETLDKGLGLEALIQSRQQELEEQEQAIARAKQDLEGVKAAIGSLKQQKTGLETSIKDTREKVSQEIMKITPLARDTINRLAEELRRGHSEALVEVRRLRDEALEVGKEVGRYEGIVEANEWLNGLLGLARGEENVEGKRVRAITLLVLRGIAIWLKRQDSHSLSFTSLSLTIERLISELEAWEV
jgi:predicted  nucleic acid-binding Zn-ribbon protein